MEQLSDLPKIPRISIGLLGSRTQDRNQYDKVLHDKLRAAVKLISALGL